MSAVPHATDGLFCDHSSLSVSNGQVWDGLFCDVEVIVPPPPPPGPTGRGSGPTDGIQPLGYTRHHEDALEETRRKRILQEDEELAALIVSLITRDLL